MSNQPYAHIQAHATTAAPVDDAWHLLTDWPVQSRWIPFTKVTNDNATRGAGARFTARTGIGPLGFDDSMELTVWNPPTGQGSGHCHIRKTGRWIRGTATIQVAATSGTTSPTTIVWTEDVRIAGVSAAFNSILCALGGILFRRALRLAVRELDEISRGSSRF